MMIGSLVSMVCDFQFQLLLHGYVSCICLDFQYFSLFVELVAFIKFLNFSSQFDKSTPILEF